MCRDPHRRQSRHVNDAETRQFRALRPAEVSVELFVGNLPWSMDDGALQALFAQHGNVQRAKVITDRETGKSRGFGFVTMGSPADGQKVIQALNGQDCEGRALTVRAAEDRRPAGGGGGGGGRGGGGGGYGGGGGRGGGGGGGGGGRY